MKNHPLFYRVVLILWMCQSSLASMGQLCNLATPINFGQALSGTASGTSLASSYSCVGGSYLQAERVYSFTMPEAGTASITLTMSSGPSVGLFLLDKLCTTSSCLAFGSTSINNFPLSSGNYFIVLDGTTAGLSQFTISLDAKNNAGYCFADYEGSCSAATIQSVSITSPGSVSTEQLNSGCPSNPAGFSTFPVNPASIFRDGSTVTITVNQTGGSSAVWLDLNNNGSFQDALEFIGHIFGSPGIHTYTFNVPSTFVFGQHRLRIRNATVDFSSGMPCVPVAGGGETEDYILNLEPKNCTPSYSASCAGGFINSVVLKNLVNQNSGCNGNPFNYIFHPSNQFTTNLSVGVTYPCTIALGGNIKSVAIYIDFNNDGDFLDAGELFIQKSGSTTFSTWSFSFVLPAGSSPGSKRMRIRCLDAARTWSQADACALLTGAGETEEYIITVVQPSISITSADINACRGTNYILNWTTTGEFNSGNRLFAQFSDHLGNFTNGGITEINLSAVGSATLQVPANLTPGGAHLLRISASNPVVVSNVKTVSIPTSGCTTPALTALRVGPSNTMTLCKGTTISVPFASVNFPSGTTFKAQILPATTGASFMDIPGAVSISSPISATIPFSFVQGSGQKIRVVSSTGVNSNTSSTLLTVNTCLSISPAPTSLCKGLPVSLPMVCSGVPAGTNIAAELSSSAGSFTSPITIGRIISSPANPTSISVTIPCETANGTGYKIRLVPDGSIPQAGTSTGNITINTNCTPLLSAPYPSTLFGQDAFCLGKTYRIGAELFAFGCFNTGNQFFIDFLQGSPTGPVLASVLVDAGGNFTIPANQPPGSNFYIRLRSTSPVATGEAVGEYPVEACPEITVTSVCRPGPMYAVSFTTNGTFGPGNQFRVQLKSGSTTEFLGNPGTGSPLFVPFESSGFPVNNRTISVIATEPVISSNELNFPFPPACPGTITVTSFSTILGVQGSPTPTPKVTACRGGKIRVDFTATGIYSPQNIFTASLVLGETFHFDFPQTGSSSPLIVEVPPGITLPSDTVRLLVRSSEPTHYSDDRAKFSLGTCPTMTITSISQSEMCNSPSISFSFSKTGTFNPGNTFSVELSDANGSFSNPINMVGSGTTSPLSLTLPAQFIPNGTGYRFRLKSTNPALVGNSTTANRSKTGPVLNGSTLGPKPVGSVVNLVGTNLTGVNGATLNGTAASFSVVSSTLISATTPNTTTGNWIVRKNGCVSNPILQLVGPELRPAHPEPGTSLNRVATINVQKEVNGIEDQKLSPPFHLFPSPTTGLVTLHHSGKEAAEVIVINLMGQILYSDRMSENQLEKEINLSSLANGVYLLKYRSQSSFVEVRLLKN